jgi:TonB family protein
MTVSRKDSLLDESLDDPFDDGNNFAETMTGIAVTVGKKISGVAETITSRSKPKTKPQTKPKTKAKTKPKTKPIANASPPTLARSETSAGLMQNPKILGGAAVAVVIIAVIAWFSLRPEGAPPVALPGDSAIPPATRAEAGTLPAQSLQPATEAMAPADYLAAARDARDAGQLISPAGNNAIELYVSALQAAPADSAIAAELDAVVEQVFAIAESGILNQELDQASTALQLLHFASPDNPRLPFLSAQLTQLQLRSTLDGARVAIGDVRFEDATNLIANARILAGSDAAEVNAVAEELDAARADQRVGEVVAMANERLEQNQLIAPVNDNARFYYQLVLGNEPDNAAARQGLMVVASKLALQALVAIDAGQLTNAEDLLRNARALDPSSAELAASTIALDTAKAARIQATADAQATVNAQAEADRLVEQERVAEQQRIAEKERVAEQERIAEQQRIADEQRQAEDSRQAAAATASAATAALTSAAGSDASGGNTDTLSASSSPAENALVAAPNSSADTRASSAETSNAGNALAEGAQPGDTVPPSDQPAPGGKPVDSALAQENSDVTKVTTAAVVLNTSSANGLNATPVVAPNAAASTRSDPAPPVEKASGNQAGEIELVPVSSLTRINYVAPKYPRSARRRNVTGSVEVSFKIQRNGTVTDVIVVESTPGTTFNQAALDAIAQWRFEPPVENGGRVEKRTVVRLAFNLE